MPGMPAPCPQTCQLGRENRPCPLVAAGDRQAARPVSPQLTTGVTGRVAPALGALGTVSGRGYAPVPGGARGAAPLAGCSPGGSLGAGSCRDRSWGLPVHSDPPAGDTGPAGCTLPAAQATSAGALQWAGRRAGQSHPVPGGDGAGHPLPSSSWGAGPGQSFGSSTAVYGGRTTPLAPSRHPKLTCAWHPSPWGSRAHWVPVPRSAPMGWRWCWRAAGSAATLPGGGHGAS